RVFVLRDELPELQEEVRAGRQSQRVPGRVERRALVVGRRRRLDDQEIPPRPIAVNVQLAWRQSRATVRLVATRDELEERRVLSRRDPIDLDELARDLRRRSLGS